MAYPTDGSDAVRAPCARDSFVRFVLQWSTQESWWENPNKYLYEGTSYRL